MASPGTSLATRPPPPPNRHLSGAVTIATTTGTTGSKSPTGDHYDATYYATYCGGAYERTDHWLRFFASIADRVVADIAPRTVLDAGCAIGLLVEALRDRGIEADGVDLSEHAISLVPEPIRPYCRVGSILEPLLGQYDLVTCIEVIEHLDEQEASTAIVNLCAATDDILLSTTPEHYDETTHVNVRPAEYWTALFAANGFFHDLDFDASFISPWAVRYRRRRDLTPRIVADYERVVARLTRERLQRTTLLLSMDNELVAARAQIAALEAKVADLERRRPDAVAAEMARLEEELSRIEAEGVAAAVGSTELERRLWAQVEAYDRELRQAHAELDAYRRSIVLRNAGRLQHAVRRALPADTRRGRSLTRLVHGAAFLARQGPEGLAEHVRNLEANTAAPSAPASEGMAEQTSAPTREELEQEAYDRWLAVHEPDADGLRALRAESEAWSDAALVSVILPVYNAALEWLDGAIESVRAQSYTRWELCIADDASSNPDVRPHLEAWAERETRIKLVVRSDNGGIAKATNSALSIATGELVAFLDHDDVLRPHALHESAALLREHVDHVMTYSDEDRILPDGRRSLPYFKGAFSEDLLLSNNYMCHFLVARRSVVEAVGGLREGFDGSQDHDLILRLSELGAVGHIAQVLYSWRQVAGSTALDGNEKTYAWDAGVRVVEGTLRRRGIAGTVQKGDAPGWYFVRREVLGDPRVTVIIPTRDRLDLLRRSIASVERRTTYGNWTLVVVDNDSSDPETLAYLAGLKYPVVPAPGHFNYSRIMNIGVAATSGTHILMLNNDVEIITPEWMTAMVEHSQRPEVGAVGARLLFPDGKPQHEGIRLGKVFIAGNIDHGGYYGLGRSIRDVSAVTGACLMMRRSVYGQVGGFDERLRVAFNDVDLCMRIRQAGYRIIYQPLAQLYHAESSSRGRLHPFSDERLLVSMWGGPGALIDPYVNPYVRNYSPLDLDV